MRLYKAFLYLYPAAFRTEYRDELCHVFSDRRRSTTGPLSTLWLWIDTLSDTVINASRVHWDMACQDLRYAGRALSRSPGFASTAVVVTALGIGANTAVFSLTDRVLIRPLPFADPERLVKLWENVPQYSRLEASPANYRDWRSMSTVFESMAAFHFWPVNLVGQGEPVRLRAVAVSSDLFPILGIGPLLGRYVTADDTAEASPRVIVLSHGLWQRVFGADRSVLNTDVRLDDATYTIVGVMPENFHFPNRDTDLWIARRFTPQDFEDRDNNYLHVLAKLGAGISLDEARAEMDVVTEQLELAHPVENADTHASIVSLRDDFSSQSRLLLAALFGASLCVLLIACTNLANLFLTRAMERRNELMVRTALGGGRERLVRQLLTESLLLSLVGGAFGVVLASLGAPLLARLVPTSLPIGEATAIDFRVLGFAAALTCLTGIGLGVLPALRTGSGIDLSRLREGARAAVGGRRGRVRSALVVAQVTASVVLLIASGLLIRALWRIQEVDPGFRTQGVVAFETPLPLPKYAETVRRAQFYERVLSEVRAMPGVSDAAYTSFLPMAMRGGIWPVTIEGPTEETEASYTASLRFATPGLFSAMSIPVQLGRDVSNADTPDSPLVAVVSESFVRRYWPDRDPLGRSFHFAFADRTVVGVVGNIRVRGLERPSEPQVYLPHQQVPDGGLIFYAPKELVVRSSTDRALLMSSVRRIVQSADPELPIAKVRALEEVVSEQTAPRSAQIRVLSVFVALSLVLSGIGIYGLLSFTVSRRQGEIGLRIALGARASDVLVMVLKEGALLAVLGAVVGAALAYVAGRAMEALLAGVRPDDTATYLIAVSAAVMITLAGSYVPALRAARVDPTMTMRAE